MTMHASIHKYILIDPFGSRDMSNKVWDVFRNVLGILPRTGNTRKASPRHAIDRLPVFFAVGAALLVFCLRSQPAPVEGEKNV